MGLGCITGAGAGGGGGCGSASTSCSACAGLTSDKISAALAAVSTMRFCSWISTAAAAALGGFAAASVPRGFFACTLHFFILPSGFSSGGSLIHSFSIADPSKEVFSDS
jgi:hypothetical protein